MWKNDTFTTAGCPAGCPRLRSHWGEQRLAPLRTDSLGRFSWGPVPWSVDPSGKHCFNRSGRVSGLGKSSWYASQITSFTIVYSSVYSGAHQGKHQSSVSLAFVRGIHRWSVNSPLKGPVTRIMFLFDDVIMLTTDPRVPHHGSPLP